MLNDVISACTSLVLALIIALPLGKALKHRPVVFYLVALALVAAFLAYKYSGTYVRGMQVYLDILQKGYLACALLAIVMFTGVLDESSGLRRRLQPIRAELSILSFILICGHILTYLPSYLPRLGAIFASHASTSISIVLAFVLTLVYALLSLLSLRVFRMRMPYRTWKRIQRLAYLMVALLFGHILFVLGRPALSGHGSTSAQLALGVYIALIALYAALRVRKALRDRAASASQQAS